MPSKKKDDKKRKFGPEPERVKIAKPWEEAVEDALKKKHPKKGSWPKERKKNK